MNKLLRNILIRKEKQFIETTFEKVLNNISQQLLTDFKNNTTTKVTIRKFNSDTIKLKNNLIKKEDNINEQHIKYLEFNQTHISMDNDSKFNQIEKELKEKQLEVETLFETIEVKNQIIAPKIN